MYFHVYLFQNKSTGSHEVDFVLGKKMVGLQNLMSPNGVGGGVNRRGGLIAKKRLPKGGAYQRGGDLIARWGFIEI